MTDFDLPQPRIMLRKINEQIQQQAIDKGLTLIQARILAGRLPVHDIDDLIATKLSKLYHPTEMTDILTGAKLVAKAIIARQRIGIVTDHDCDGQTSHAIIYHNLTKHFNTPKNKIRSYIGNRLTEGYGLSIALQNRILNDEHRPDLIITADCGSSDEERINNLSKQGITVVVTDHHQIPKDNFPVSAAAFINPSREDCTFKDRYIAGCMVVWLLMTMVRHELINENYLGKDAPKLLDSLDYVALGTVADCVSIGKSTNNRAVVNYGLRLINSLAKPCWQVLLQDTSKVYTATDLAFEIAPLLNSDGRLDSALGAVGFLLADATSIAEKQLLELQIKNKQRKQIQAEIVDYGVNQAIHQVTKNKLGICIFHEQGHVGVHGIAASRIKEMFGRPVAYLAPKPNGLVGGSLRSIDTCHVQQLLTWINDNYPRLLLAFGGHAGAGGMTIERDKVELFAQAFELAISKQISLKDVGPVIMIDGELEEEHLSIETVQSFAELEPYGREFELPVFRVKGLVTHFKLIGNGLHAKLSLKINSKIISAIWFNFRRTVSDSIPKIEDKMVECAAHLQINNFRGRENCQLQILSCHIDG